MNSEEVTASNTSKIVVLRLPSGLMASTAPSILTSPNNTLASSRSKRVYRRRKRPEVKELKQLAGEAIRDILKSKKPLKSVHISVRQLWNVPYIWKVDIEKLKKSPLKEHEDAEHAINRTLNRPANKGSQPCHWTRRNIRTLIKLIQEGILYPVNIQPHKATLTNSGILSPIEEEDINALGAPNDTPNIQDSGWDAETDSSVCEDYAESSADSNYTDNDLDSEPTISSGPLDACNKNRRLSRRGYIEGPEPQCSPIAMLDPRVPSLELGDDDDLSSHGTLAQTSHSPPPSLPTLGLAISRASTTRSEDDPDGEEVQVHSNISSLGMAIENFKNALEVERRSKVVLVAKVNEYEKIISKLNGRIIVLKDQRDNALSELKVFSTQLNELLGWFGRPNPQPTP